MPKICEVTNHLDPISSLKETEVEVGFAICDYVTNSPGLHYHISINNKPALADSKLHEGDVAVFVPCVHGNILIGIVIALIVAAAIYFFMASGVPTNTGLPEPDPVYTFRGQQNQLKENDPIERHYGEVRHWPSYASRPYNQFIGNEQWLYALFCVGLGECIVTDVLVDDTPIENFENAEYQVCLPGEKVTLFPTSVQTSSEVAGIELIGTNEDGHDWSGPFNIVSSGHLAYRIEVDVSFRNGLYKTNDKGELEDENSRVDFQIREIDDEGDPIGSWVTIIEFEQNLATTDTERFTVSETVEPGRYQIRAKRINDVSDSFKRRSTTTWEGCRAFIRTKQDFGDVTLLAVKVQASNNLNDTSRNKFNVRLKSKSWSYSKGTGLWTIQQTRSPVWAACDILISKYGKFMATSYLDADRIADLAAEIKDEDIYFDGTFDQQGTVWQSIVDCLMSSRCRPNLPGSLFSIVRDSPMSLPTLCLNGHNIIKDSVKVNHEFSKIRDNDGMEVEYVDPVSWERKTVMCLIGYDKGTNPERVRLPGCKNRNAAYRWGMYARATKVYQRTNVTVSTGLEGATVTFGDLVAMQHDLLPNEEIIIPEHTGRIAGLAYHSGATTIIPLPFAPFFEPAVVHRIALRGRDGSMLGPFICTAGVGNTVVINALLVVDEINTDDNEEAATYFFGPTGKEVALFKIIGITPGEYGIVNLTLSPYDERLYTFGALTAPPENTNFDDPIAVSTPVVTGLEVTQLPQTLEEVTAKWTPALGAIDYIVEMRYSTQTAFKRIVQVPFSSTKLIVKPGYLHVRVAAVGVRKGPWAYWEGNIGVPATIPYKSELPFVSEEFTGSTLYLAVEATPLATSYKWKAYIGATLISTTTTTLPNFSYASKTAKADAVAAATTLQRTMSFTVTGSNAIGDGPPSDALLLTNPAPDAPTGLAANPVQTIDLTKRCIFTWDPSDDIDIESYRLHISTTIGFTPDPSNLVASTLGLAAEAIIPTGVLHYYRVGAKDRWGDDVTYSGEVSITP